MANSSNSLLSNTSTVYKSKSSRYRNTPQHDNWAQEDDFVLYPDPDDTQFFVDISTAGRPDLIAFALYGNPLYSWAIMRRNGILHPSHITVGMLLWVPSTERLHDSGGIFSQ